MSQGAEKSQSPEVGIEPEPQDLKANTQPRRCKSRLLPQGSRCVLYMPIPSTYAFQVAIAINTAHENRKMITVALEKIKK